MNYQKHFSDFINSLRKDKQVVISSHAVLSPLKAKEIRAMAKRYKVKLAPSIIEFYRQVNGVDIVWYTPNATLSEIGGRIYINSLEQFLQALNFTQQYMQEGLISQSLKEELDHFRVFEGSAEQTIGFFEQDGYISDQLHYYDTLASQNTCQALPYTIETYLKAIFQTRGSVFKQQISKVA